MGSGVAPLLWSPARAATSVSRQVPNHGAALGTHRGLQVEVKLVAQGHRKLQIRSEALRVADPKASALGRRDQAIDR